MRFQLALSWDTKKLTIYRRGCQMGTSLRSGTIALKAATTARSTSPMTAPINRVALVRPSEREKADS
jgi:hypothetical protein